MSFYLNLIIWSIFLICCIFSVFMHQQGIICFLMGFLHDPWFSYVACVNFVDYKRIWSIHWENFIMSWHNIWSKFMLLTLCICATARHNLYSFLLHTRGFDPYLWLLLLILLPKGLIFGWAWSMNLIMLRNHFIYATAWHSLYSWSYLLHDPWFYLVAWGEVLNTNEFNPWLGECCMLSI